VDTGSDTSWYHYWENCVGSGHAVLGLRQDWREHIKMAHDDLGFKMVRFHGVFDDDMSVILMENNGKTLTYSWFNVDQVYDFLLSIGMKPYVELSFMPELIASNGGKHTIMHYKAITDPPATMNDWYNLIVAFETHFIERYGIDEVASWYQECWNEPNCGFWAGNLTQYFQFFQTTSQAMKSVSPRLKIGGPVTCESGYIPDFLDFVKKNNVAYDFIATHEYPTDPNIPHENGGERVAIAKTRELIGYNEILSYSEYNDGLFYYPSYHDTPYAAAFIIQNVALMHGLTDLFSWWTFTDIFEEPGQYSQPFFRNEGWGLLNNYGIPKPSYRAFQLLHQTGNRRFQVTNLNGTNTATLFALATNVVDHSNEVFVFVVNYNIPNKTLQTEAVDVIVKSKIPFHAQLKAHITRIDDTHANAPNSWLAMGSPLYPTKSQNEVLLEKSKLVHEAINFTKPDPYTVQFSAIQMPPQSVAVIRLY